MVSQGSRVRRGDPRALRRRGRRRARRRLRASGAPTPRGALARVAAARPVHAQRLSRHAARVRRRRATRWPPPIDVVDAGHDRALDSLRALRSCTCRSSTPRTSAMQERSLALFARLAANRRSRRRSNGRKSTRRSSAASAAIRTATRSSAARRRRRRSRSCAAGLALLADGGRRDRTAMQRVLGIFGGTFDPDPLRAPRARARSARRAGPRRGAPHPRRRPAAPRGARRHARRTAGDGRARRRRLSRASRSTRARSTARGRSYTVLTLEELRAEEPARPLALIVGADAFLGLPTWHRWREIFDLAHVVVVARPGVALEGALPPPLARRMGAALSARRGGAVARRPPARSSGSRSRAHADLRVGDTRAARARRRRHRRGARFASGRRFGLY